MGGGTVNKMMPSGNIWYRHPKGKNGNDERYCAAMFISICGRRVRFPMGFVRFSIVSLSFYAEICYTLI